MNKTEMLRILDSIARDRGVDKQVLAKDLELAMVSAARKYFNALDPDSIRVFTRRTCVRGS